MLFKTFSYKIVNFSILIFPDILSKATVIPVIKSLLLDKRADRAYACMIMVALFVEKFHFLSYGILNQI